MIIRRPPDDYVPRVVRGGQSQTPRVIHYEEPKAPFFRRLLRALFKPYIILPVLVLTAFGVGFLIYYWLIFSVRIDYLLKKEVFTRSAGIYAAPKQIRTGEAISQDDLIGYLKRAGYVERGQQGESARGRYVRTDSSIEIDPGADARVDSAQPFEDLRVQFTRGGKSITTILNSKGTHLDRTQLEPELISSVTGRERAKRRVIGFNDLRHYSRATAAVRY